MGKFGIIFSMLSLVVLQDTTGIPLSTNFGCGNKPADIIFILDASSSIWGPDFHKQIAFVHNLVEAFDISPTVTRCGALTFSDHVREEFNLNTYLSKSPLLRDGLGSISQLRGGTRTDLALQKMRQQFQNNPRPDVPKIAVLLTDGESTMPEKTAEQASLVHQEGITLFAIGVGRNVVRAELEILASSEDNVFEVDSHDALQTILGILVNKTCEVETEEPLVRDCGSRPADVVFALDASGSIWGLDFQRQLQFVQDLVDDFDISPTSTRIAVLTFGTEPKKQFHLDDYSTAVQVKNAIGEIQQSRGSTNTSAALHRMRMHFFDGVHSREGVVKIGIVITDGSSNNPQATAHQAALARQHGIHIFAVGVGQDVDPDELEAIASRPKDRYVFSVDDFMGLEHIRRLLSRRTCEVTIPPPTLPTETATFSTAPHTTSPPTTTTEPTTAFFVAKTTKKSPPEAAAMLSDQASCSHSPTDIVFAIPNDADSSKTMQALALMHAVSSQLDISENGVHMGLLPKDCYSIPGFHLKEGHDKVKISQLLDSAQLSISDTAAQLKYLRDKAFAVENGGREAAKKIGVLILDKNSYQSAETELEAWYARESIELFVIGIGDAVSDTELKSIASEPQGSHIYKVKDFCDLVQMAKHLTSRIKQVCSSN